MTSELIYITYYARKRKRREENNYDTGNKVMTKSNASEEETCVGNTAARRSRRARERVRLGRSARDWFRFSFYKNVIIIVKTYCSGGERV